MTDLTASRPVPRLGDRFLVVNTLGDGGTATVYLSYDTRGRGWVALKALHKRYIDDEEMQRRFAFEARALEMLRHPNIPRLVEFAPESRPPFMAMELARCGSAMDWVRKHGPMPPQMACEVVIQVCDAVAEAHGKGMIHRDIKPHNVLLDDTGLIKLTDFGIARLDDTTSLTATGSQIGTFSFMAPEQRSDTKTVDLRADVYSLGSSFYTMLTGRTSAELFVAESDDSLMQAVPEPLRPIILTATKYQPDERFESAEAMREAVRAVLPTLDPPPPEAPPLVPTLEPLPSGPPARIPTSRAFPELEGLVAGLGDASNAPTSVPPQSGWSSLPYRMPARHAQQRTRPQELAPPAMLAPVRNSTPKSLSRDPAPVRVEPGPTKPSHLAPQDGSGAGISSRVAIQVTVLLLGLVGLVGLFVVAVLGAGAVTVTMAQHGAVEQALKLRAAVHAESTLVSKMRGDRTEVRRALERFENAEAEDAQIRAAIDFISTVEQARARPDSFEHGAEVQVQRLRAARENYLQARRTWASSVTQFPGRVAHGWGVVSGPR